MLEISNPSTGDKIEVAEVDLGDTMSFDEAVNACKKLGDSWRLPNNEEILLIYNELHLNNKGNFDTGIYYWTATEKDDSNAYLFDFSTGELDYSQKYVRDLVRPVRTR